MQDYDSVGYWLKGIPYIWVPGKNFEDSKRYYFANPEVELFNEGNKTALQRVWARTSELTGNDEILEFSLSFFSCQKWPRNYFLVIPFKPNSWKIQDSKLIVKPVAYWLEEREWWGTKGKKFEFRLEGKKADVVPAIPEYKETVEVYFPNKKVKVLPLAPPELLSTFSYPILGVSNNKIVGVVSKKTGKHFSNIVQLASFLDLPLEERKNLHEECLAKKSGKHDFLYDFLDKPERERKRGEAYAEWYNKVWANEILWGGPLYADEGVMDHEPYQLDIA
ncbi:hypothetical protein [Brazilian marseillevirus]|uniref:hypothetical protein n=1 Tax=Brazilian marseillevirus TaxID=1813599 RepID=UPI00078614A8|nr:hypothetical protein A3303_gp284 [Brazilian marseillevirus]AMQ10792.1 hypothetical protein [Brazilian marseillevirus]